MLNISEFFEKMKLIQEKFMHYVENENNIEELNDSDDQNEFTIAIRSRTKYQFLRLIHFKRKIISKFLLSNIN